MHIATRPPLARIMVIDQSLREDRWPNARTLAEHLEIHPRTVRRDIEYLRDQLHAPIEFDSRKNGYHYSEPSFRLPFVQMTGGELVALLLAQRLLRQYRGTPFESDLRRLFAKLNELLPGHVSVPLDEASNCLAVLPPVETEYDPAVFASLSRAVVERRRVEVLYHTAESDVRTTRVFDPYHLVLRGDDWFVVAHDSHRGEVRTFALQRVLTAVILDETFDRPDDFDLGTYLGTSFKAIRGDGQHRVEMIFRPPSALRVSEKTWHPTQTLESLPDGRLCLRFEVGDLREVKRWVMSWGADCVVAGPDELREMVVEELKSMLLGHDPEDGRGGKPRRRGETS